MDRIERAVINCKGRWPSGNPDRLCVLGRYEDGSYGCWASGENLRASNEVGYICTYPEFMAARRRLENKPTEWPEGADWVMQDLRGHWSFSSGEEPKPCAQTWHIDQRYIDSGLRGHVFGDWRKSLERLPDHIASPGKKGEPDWPEAPEGAQFTVQRRKSAPPRGGSMKMAGGGASLLMTTTIDGVWGQCSKVSVELFSPAPSRITKRV